MYDVSNRDVLFFYHYEKAAWFLLFLHSSLVPAGMGEGQRFRPLWSKLVFCLSEIMIRLIPFVFFFH